MQEMRIDRKGVEKGEGTSLCETGMQDVREIPKMVTKNSLRKLRMERINYHAREIRRWKNISHREALKEGAYLWNLYKKIREGMMLNDVEKRTIS